MADLKQWNGNFEQAVKEQQEKHEQRRREIDKEATTVFTIFFIFVGIMIVCSCVAVCVRWIAVTRAANRVHGPPIMGGGMMMGQPVMGGGMTVGQPGTVMYQQTNYAVSPQQQAGMYTQQPTGAGLGGGASYTSSASHATSV